MSIIRKFIPRWYASGVIALLAQAAIDTVACSDTIQLLVLETGVILITWAALGQIGLHLLKNRLPKTKYLRVASLAALAIAGGVLAVVLTFYNIYQASWQCLI